MAITKIEVRNFKSFRELSLELGNFNVLIGSNASGKSNAVSIFQFLRDIKQFGLDDAISMQGGIEYLTNVNVGPTEEVFVSFDSIYKESSIVRMIRPEDKFLHLMGSTFSYKFSLRTTNNDYSITEDSLQYNVDLYETHQSEGKAENKFLCNGTIQYYIENGDFKVKTNFPIHDLYLSLNSFISPHMESVPDNKLLIEYQLPIWHFYGKLLDNLSIYDIDPKIPKKATPITGKAHLEGDGSNLSIVLKNILSDEEKRKRLASYVRDLLPFVDDLNVEKFADKSLLFSLKERYAADHYLPASMVSDGTIGVTALVLVLYFEDESLAIFEEPEKSIHPRLISKIVEMMKDASKEKQIIVTTHNPELVKHAGMDSLLLVSRDEDGFSRITRPADSEEVRVFLENDMGVDELFVQNLLEF